MSFCPSSLDNCIVLPFSIYSLWLPPLVSSNLSEINFKVHLMNFVFDRRVLLLRQEHTIFLLPIYPCRCPCYRQFYCLSLFALKCSITDLIGCISYATLTMFGSSLSLVVYRGPMSYICYLCLLVHNGDKHVLTIWVTLRMYYNKQGLLTVRERLGSLSICGGIRVAHHFSFLCCVMLFVFCLSSSCVLCAQCCQNLWIVHRW